MVAVIWKSVELGMLKMSVNISAWVPQAVRVTNSYITLTNILTEKQSREILLCCQKLLFKRLDKVFNLTYNGFFPLFSFYFNNFLLVSTVS